MTTNTREGHVTRDELEELGDRARRWRLSGDHYSDSETPLVGKCFDNAYVCYQLLSENGYDAMMIEGTTTRLLKTTGNSDLLRDIENVDSITNALESVHYWVGINIDEEAWMIDIASDTENTYGDVVIADTIAPNGYHVFSDSVSEGEKTLQMVEQRGDRCRYCGGNKYKTGGCPQCYTQS